MLHLEYVNGEIFDLLIKEPEENQPYLLVYKDEYSDELTFYVDYFEKEEEEQERALWKNSPCTSDETLFWSASIPTINWDEVQSDKLFWGRKYLILLENGELCVAEFTFFGWVHERAYEGIKWLLIEEPDAPTEIGENILREIPRNIPELFAEARRMKRNFVLHIGPTNAGKTFSAFQELKAAESGAYLAPLRLLALEKAEEMNAAGVPCTLLTGEECIEIPNARHISATVEMATSFGKMECAIIDEAQMVTDPSRGGAWTEAILGIQAKRIHICLSPWAKETIIEMIESCGETYEIINHERMTPLVVEDKEFSFPEDVREHDALVVFSRRSVHEVAEELEYEGISCSIIYGALPHDVRQEEARKFRAGETQVVVSTDAIGMGLNLPIERVVFIENEKFDGYDRRPLNGEEIRQIAGRAGRRGMYPVGYVNTTSEYAKKKIRRSIEQFKAPNGNIPVIGFPRKLLAVNGSISEIAMEWVSMTWQYEFLQADLSDFISLARIAERITSDKEMVYKFSKIPFNSDNEDLFAIWKECLVWVSEGREGELNPSLFNTPVTEIQYLDVLERTYKEADLYYHIGKILADKPMRDAANRVRREVSDEIIRRLSKKALPSAQ